MEAVNRKLETLSHPLYYLLFVGSCRGFAIQCLRDEGWGVGSRGWILVGRWAVYISKTEHSEEKLYFFKNKVEMRLRDKGISIFGRWQNCQKGKNNLVFLGVQLAGPHAVARRKNKNPLIYYSTAEDGLLLLRILKHWGTRSKLQGRAHFRTASAHVQGNQYYKDGFQWGLGTRILVSDSLGVNHSSHTHQLWDFGELT